MRHKRRKGVQNMIEEASFMSKEIRSEIISRSLSIVSTLLFLVVSTWLWFGPSQKLRNTQSTMAGSFIADLVFQDMSEGIHLTNAYPVRDEVGQAVDPYVFSITNRSTEPISYQIAFSNDKLAIQQDQCQILVNTYLRYIIQKDEQPYTTPVNLEADGVMYQDELQPGQSAVYRLKFWIDYEAGNEIMNTHFHGRVVVDQASDQLAYQK